MSQPAAQVAADVGAEGQAAEGQRDQAHDLPEHGSRLVTGQRYRLGERGSGHGASLPRGRPRRARVTPGRRPGRAGPGHRPGTSRARRSSQGATVVATPTL